MSEGKGKDYLPIDAGAVWNQISQSAKTQLGVDSILQDEKEVIIPIHGYGPYRKLIIRLTGLDLYDIEYGRVKRGTLEWVTIKTVEDVEAGNLDIALIALTEPERG